MDLCKTLAVSPHARSHSGERKIERVQPARVQRLCRFIPHGKRPYIPLRLGGIRTHRLGAQGQKTDDEPSSGEMETSLLHMPFALRRPRRCPAIRCVRPSPRSTGGKVRLVRLVDALRPAPWFPVGGPTLHQLPVAVFAATPPWRTHERSTGPRRSAIAYVHAQRRPPSARARSPS